MITEVFGNFPRPCQSLENVRTPMIEVDDKHLNSVLDMLRVERSDNQYYEVKSAVGGMPQSIDTTISALVNTPGGGVIILGVDENAGFSIVGVYDSKQCQQTLANLARNGFSSPITIRTTLLIVDGKPVVWAAVLEADRSLKPVKTKSSGRSYVRLYDGDYELSDQEEQLFVAGRGPSHFDEEAIKKSGASDLNPGLIQAYIANRKAHSQVLGAYDDEEILLRTNVTSLDGELTVAGAVALGKYPQQFMPNYSIKVSVRKKSQPKTIRAINANSLDGPIPVILEAALRWVEQNTDELTIETEDGRVRNVREYPINVVRELVSNALIHRDMNPVSMFQNITLTIEDNRMVISNPGGLYGITVKELGHTGSKTRNEKIADICQYIVAADGRNVVEKLGSGIPRVLEELSDIRMPPPTFIDGGIYFTVILESARQVQSQQLAAAQNPPKRSNPEKVEAALRAGALSRAELEKATGLSTDQVRYALTKLTGQNKVQKVGNGTSAATKYALL
jgi:ATP-dependent DNA helicase RecG